MALSSGWNTQTRSAAAVRISLAMILTSLSLAPARTDGQSVSGALGVSVNVLPPIMTQGVELIAFGVERNGIARLETTSPIAGAVSLIVMTTVSKLGERIRSESHDVCVRISYVIVPGT